MQGDLMDQLMRLTLTPRASAILQIHLPQFCDLNSFTSPSMRKSSKVWDIKQGLHMLLLQEERDGASSGALKVGAVTR